jgi:hypothetical protein
MGMVGGVQQVGNVAWVGLRARVGWMGMGEDMGGVCV